MSTHEVLTQCQARDVRLSVANGSLTYDAPKGALLPDLLALLKERKTDLLAALTQPANLETLLGRACQDVEGIDAATFLALLSPVDVEDIEGGHIPVVTLNAYVRSIAEGIRVGRIKVLADATDSETAMQFATAT